MATFQLEREPLITFKPVSTIDASRFANIEAHHDNHPKVNPRWSYDRMLECRNLYWHKGMHLLGAYVALVWLHQQSTKYWNRTRRTVFIDCLAVAFMHDQLGTMTECDELAAYADELLANHYNPRKR